MFETFIKGQMSLERITCLEITQQKNANLVALSDISLMVHLTITLANDQLDAQIFNTFITLLYMYMFRAVLLILRSNCINTASGIVTLSK